jgi:hypothetical protein
MKRNRLGVALAGLSLLQLALSMMPASCRAQSNSPDLYVLPSQPEISIRPEAIGQGAVGDCYFLSALASLAKVDPGAIARMIKTNPDGTYTVTFPGASDEPITVAAPTPEELSTYARNRGFGTWPAVMEKAYGVYCSRSWLRRDVLQPISSSTPQKNTDGSYFHDGIKILTGGGVSTDWTSFTSYSTMVSRLTKAFEDHKIVTVDTSKFANAEKLPTNHEYSVLGFTPNLDDPKKSLVTIRNPWGQKEPVDAQGQPKDGVDDGIFDMTLEEMSNVFHSIAIGDKPVPVIAKESPETTPPPVVPPPVPFDDTRPQVTISEDGTKVTRQKYRPTIYEHTDGTVERRHGDGTVVTEKPDGSMHMVMTDGREYWEMPDGTRIWHYPDGTKVTQKPDKTEITEFPSGGKLTELPDGTKIHEFTTGSGTSYRETDKPDGTKIVEKSDGSVTQTSMSKPVANDPVNFRSLESEVQSGNLACKLYGDGETTTQCILLVSNPTPAVEHVRMPKYECFVPANPQSQVMMTTGTKDFNVPPKGQLAIVIPTICASTKNQQAPTALGQSYLPSEPKGTYQIVKDIVDASERLAKQGAYDAVPVARDSRQATFCQLAVWMENGKKPEDEVTRKSIGNDIGQKAGLDISTLNLTQKRHFDANIDEIFKTADLTRKEGHKLAAAGSASGS